MPKVLKQRGVVPAEDSVAIPDIVFSHQAATAPPPPDSQEDPAVLIPEAGEDECFPDDALQPAGSAAPALTPEELELIYREELTALRQQAATEGKREAREEIRTAVQAKLDGVDETLTAMQRLQDSFIRQYGSTLKYTALEIAEKFIGQRIEADDAILQQLVMQTVAAVKNADWLNVEISDRLEHLIAELRAELAAPKYQGRVSVTPVAAPDDTCRVTSAVGTLDSSIHVQAQNLRSVFDGMESE